MLQISCTIGPTKAMALSQAVGINIIMTMQSTFMANILPTMIVMIGGGIGAALRYHLGRLLMQFSTGSWPVGTFAANIIGGLCMGIFMAFLTRMDVQTPSNLDSYRLFIAVGLLGGFTTFSAFSLEIAVMIESGDWISAFGYSAASVLIALLALFAGMAMVRMAL